MLIENSRLLEKVHKKYRKNTGIVRNHKNVFLKSYFIVKYAKNAFFDYTGLFKNPFLWFLTMPVFFLYFLWTFYKSLEFSVNIPHGVKAKKPFCVFYPIFKLILWQNPIKL